MFNIDVRAPRHVCTYYRKSCEEKSDVRDKTRKYQNSSRGTPSPDKFDEFVWDFGHHTNFEHAL